MSIFNRLFGQKEQEDLDKGLEKTRVGFFDKIARAVAGKDRVDEAVLDDLEGVLVAADVGVEMTVEIIRRIEARVARDKYVSASELNNILRSEIVDMLSFDTDDDAAALVEGYALPNAVKPYIILVVGVNGVGKTTTIGKLAHKLTEQGKKVVMGAGDTFRAAAVDQLGIWAKRVGCDFYSKGMNADPAAVAYETVQHAIRTGADVAIIDTAGRLHTKQGLMNELSKIRRSIEKALPDAPHECILVLDASTGQNAIEQARHFTAATQVSGLVLTKLDGTAKGGVVLGIVNMFRIPVRFIGVGEGINQLQVFDKKAFVEAFFKVR